jgi:hypothetical protein
MDILKKPDVLFVLILLVLKYTVAPDMSWWLVFMPLLVSFAYGFIKGFIQGIKDWNDDSY